MDEWDNLWWAEDEDGRPAFPLEVAEKMLSESEEKPWETKIPCLLSWHVGICLKPSSFKPTMMFFFNPGKLKLAQVKWGTPNFNFQVPWPLNDREAAGPLTGRGLKNSVDALLRRLIPEKGSMEEFGFVCESWPVSYRLETKKADFALGWTSSVVSMEPLRTARIFTKSDSFIGSCSFPENESWPKVFKDIMAKKDIMDKIGVSSVEFLASMPEKLRLKVVEC